MRAHRTTPRQVLSDKAIAALRPGKNLAPTDQACGTAKADQTSSIERERETTAADLDKALADFHAILGAPALLARLHRAIREI